MARHRAEQAAPEDFDAATTALDDVTGDYTVDVTHTRIGFRTRHAMVTTVRGSFEQFEGSAHLDSAHPERSSVELVIDVGSITTGQADRDAHIRGEDFFDAAAYPHMAFRSTAVEQVEDGAYRVTGDLTVRAVTKRVTVDFELVGSAVDVFGATRVGFEGALVIQRSEWDLTWNAPLETGGVLISDKVQVEFDVSAVRTAPAAGGAGPDAAGAAGGAGAADEDAPEDTSEDDPAAGSPGPGGPDRATGPHPEASAGGSSAAAGS